MSLFEFKKYKDYVTFRIQAMPKRGHGQYRKIAQFLSIGSVNVTQIFKGERQLTVEQAVELCEFFGLSNLESQYFVCLVEQERAGSVKAKRFLEQRLEELREKSQDLKSRLKQDGKLTEAARATFYSDWFYSGIRLLTSIPGFDSSDALATRLELPLAKVNRVLEFLVAQGLCIEDKGRYRMGPSSTHLEASSPLISRHHTNWRLKAIERFPRLSEQELSLSMPCSLSEKALHQLRRELVNCIERLTAIIDESPSEQIACVNIDLFKF